MLNRVTGVQGNVSVNVVWKRSLETELRLEDGNRSPKGALGTVQSPQAGDRLE